jgi:hypothetical protein
VYFAYDDYLHLNDPRQELLSDYITPAILGVAGLPADATPRPLITFKALPTKALGSGYVVLTATSTNTAVPLVFASQGPSKVAVVKVGSEWRATLKAEPYAKIEATQAAGNGYRAAIDVVRHQFVTAGSTPP